MGKIIALQGKANSGKSEAITILATILKQNGYQSLAGSFKQYGKDFKEVFTNGVIIVGVTSAGDDYRRVHDRLKDFVNQGCDVCICACRTADRKPPGTIAAAKSFAGYPAKFVKKTVAPQAQWLTANTADAQHLYSLI